MAQPVIGNRLRGGLPTIGIRPVIDGRRKGVRESLESVPWKWRARLQSCCRALRHASGEPVECVIADTCIGGFAESAAAADKFARNERRCNAYRYSLLVLRLRNHGHGPAASQSDLGISTAPSGRARFTLPPLLRRTPERTSGVRYLRTQRPGAGRHVDSRRCSGEDPAVRPVGHCSRYHAGKAYLGMGGVSMGIAGSIVNPDFLENWLGMSYEGIDMSEFIRRIDEGIYDKDEFGRAMAWVKKSCVEGKDYNKPTLTKEKKRRTGNLSSKWPSSAVISWSGTRRLKKADSVKRRSAETPLPPGSRGSASGRPFSQWGFP